MIGGFDMDREESMWNALNSFNWKNGKVNYALTASELYSLIEHCKDAFTLIDNAFKYGFIKGIRYQKAQYKEKTRQ